MEEPYNFQQHSYCMVIHMDNKFITFKSFLNKLEGYPSKKPYPQKGRACITYSPEKTILDWGEKLTFRAKEDDTYVNNFLDKLYYIFKKGKSNRDENDEFLLQAISDFLRLQLNNSVEYREISNKNPNAFHYVFIVPSEWSYEIREDLIRPIFVHSKIISKDDHKDRLLFFTDLESTFCFLQDKTYAKVKGTTQVFRKGEQVILCRAGFHRNGTLSVKLDLIEPQQSLVDDVYDATLFPKVLQSIAVSMTPDYFRKSVRIFLKTKLFPKSATNCKDDTINKIAEHILNEFSKPKYLRFCKATDYSEKTLFNNVDIKEWNLTEAQTETLKSISISDICEEIDDHILKAIKILLQHNFGKRRTLILVHECYSSAKQPVSPLILWLNCFLEIKKHQSSYTLMLITHNFESSVSVFISKLMTGAANKAAEVLISSNMHALPFIMPKNPLEIEHDSPYSIFLDSKKPNVVINIDISFKSTLISYSLLNDKGEIEKIYYNSYLTGNMQLPALGAFFEVMDVETLKVKNQIISFLEKCLNKDLNRFKKYDRQIEKKREKPNSKRILQKIGSKQMSDFFFKRKETLMPEIETIFNNTVHSIDKNSTYIQQPKYVKTFLMMYLAYLNRVIFNRLPDHLNSSTATSNKNIGYVFSIEKMLLDNVIGSKKSFKELIFASEMIHKNDDSKKIRILPQGKCLLPLIRRFFELDIPLRSYFVLAQLRKNYVQLTLNQVVTVPSIAGGENNPSSIILKDEVIQIENMYDSLVTYIWHHVTENEDLVQLCDTHYKSGFENLFSLKVKEEFFKNFKKYIKDNILGNHSTNLSMNDIKMINLTCKCTCRIHLSVRDIIKIAFKPVLRGIITILSASFVNTSLFGTYKDIPHLFIMIYFNHNLHFQNVLANLLSKELDNSIEEKKLETKYFILSDFPDHLFQPKYSQKPFSYESFQVGALHQASRETYGFTVTQFKRGYKKITPLYRDRVTVSMATEVKENYVFTLLKKGDAIYSCGIDKTFYLEKQVRLVDRKNLRTGKSNRERICISLYKLKNLNDIKQNETVPSDVNSWDKVKEFSQELEIPGFQYASNIPIMISMRPKAYSSSLEFSVKIVGQDFVSSEENHVNVGEPLTLAPF